MSYWWGLCIHMLRLTLRGYCLWDFDISCSCESWFYDTNLCTDRKVRCIDRGFDRDSLSILVHGWWITSNLCLVCFQRQTETDLDILSFFYGTIISYGNFEPDEEIEIITFSCYIKKWSCHTTVCPILTFFREITPSKGAQHNWSS